MPLWLEFIMVSFVHRNPELPTGRGLVEVKGLLIAVSADKSCPSPFITTFLSLETFISAVKESVAQGLLVP